MHLHSNNDRKVCGFNSEKINRRNFIQLSGEVETYVTCSEERDPSGKIDISQ